MKNTPSFNKILEVLRSGKQSECIYCGYSFTSSPDAMRFATLEHLVPQAKTAKRRGTNCDMNTFLCCYKCNTMRRNFIPEGEFKSVLESDGESVPSWLGVVENSHSKRYFIKSEKMRRKLITEIRNQVIIPESVKLFDTWREIFWEPDTEQVAGGDRPR